MKEPGLFADPPRTAPSAPPALPEGVILLHRFCDTRPLLATVADVTAASPFRRMRVPGGGRMSARMTNCGVVGWVADTKGYRYAERDPESGRNWPPLPPNFADLAGRAAAAAGFEDFTPDMCLINEYRPGARLGAHRDSTERDRGHPIVSVSIGLPATFLWYGAARGGKALRIPVSDGDAVVFGGPARLGYHGVATLADGAHPTAGQRRVNLTLRKAL